MNASLSALGAFLALTAAPEDRARGGGPSRETAPAFYWLGAEDFEDLGGWEVDSQFVNLMGTAYLIAPGVQEPVEDAVAPLELAESGRYRVWVRMRDWLPEHSPGQYEIHIDGAPLPRRFGAAERDDWHWVPAADVELEAGSRRVALHDLTGGFGRCAAILLTTDMSYVPPHEADDVAREYVRLSERRLEPRDLGEFDVVVVGGGPSGCPAAIAAARLGARTALIQDRPVLGGNASSELGVPLEGAALIQPNARETGIVEEVSRLKAHGGHFKVSEPFRILAQAEPNLTLHLNTRITDATLSGPGRIGSLEGVDVRDGTKVTVRGAYVIDCTGDGWVGYYAGARHRVGREAKWEYGEADAPEQPDAVTMSGCLMGGKPLCFWAVDTGVPVSYEPPPWAADLPDLSETGRNPSHLFTGEWWLEHKGMRDDLYNAEEARDELIRISFGYWDYVKNEWPGREQAATYELTAVPHMLAKRESRRLIGDYVLTQNDILEDKRFDDAIAYAGWPLDIHATDGVYGGPPGPYFSNHLFEGVRQLPYRSLYSANVDNLLFAGRCVSVTHLALGTVRVQRTLASLGQAAGTAAALCVEKGCDPREIGEEHIEELQQTLLKYDQFIPHVPNRDPDDLARTARASASSVAAGDRLLPNDLTPTHLYHDLAQHHRAAILPVMHGKKVESARLLLGNRTDAPVTLRLRLLAAPSMNEAPAGEPLTVAEAELAPGEQWLEFALGAEVPADYVWLWLEAVEGVSWNVADTAFMAARRAYAFAGAEGPEDWTLRPEAYACYIEPPAEARQDYAPGNVINGWSRLVGAQANMWRSAPDEPLPQWVQLDFGEPAPLNTVHLAFATDLNSRHLRPQPDPATGEPRLAGVTSYEILGRVDGEWQTLVSETANFQRWRRHEFPRRKADALRLVVLEAVHMDSAQVYEVRAYDE